MTALFDLPRPLAERRRRPDLWHEFFRVPALSLGLDKPAKGARDATDRLAGDRSS